MQPIEKENVHNGALVKTFAPLLSASLTKSPFPIPSSPPRPHSSRSTSTPSLRRWRTTTSSRRWTTTTSQWARTSTTSSAGRRARRSHPTGPLPDATPSRSRGAPAAAGWGRPTTTGGQTGWVVFYTTVIVNLFFSFIIFWIVGGFL